MSVPYCEMTIVIDGLRIAAKDKVNIIHVELDLEMLAWIL